MVGNMLIFNTEKRTKRASKNLTAGNHRVELILLCKGSEVVHAIHNLTNRTEYGLVRPK